MIRNSQLLYTILITVVAILIVQVGLTSAVHTLAVLPFQDRSGFKGHWDLGNGISRLLSERLAQRDGYQAMDHDSLSQILGQEIERPADCQAADERAAIFDSLKVSFLVCGSVEEFSISRFGIATPQVGGYESYRAVIQASFSLWERKARTPRLEAKSEGKVTQKGLGLTFLGHPTQQMTEYEMLEQLEFGSPLYMGTIAGEATEALLTDMVEKIQVTLPPKSQSDSLTAATVLLVEEGKVYINRGFEDGIRVGDEFVVYTRGEELRDPETNELLGYSDRKVGRIRVAFVKSTHLSLAEVVEGKVVPGDEVRGE